LTGNANLGPGDRPGYALNEETGQGQATHLGLFTWYSLEEVYIVNFPPHVDVTGTFTMTAADGDLLCGEYTTSGDLNAAGELIIVGTFTIPGGTGRFVGATGGGNLFATAFFSEGMPFIGMFDGVIDY
jgi:hypothetical protein